MSHQKIISPVYPDPLAGFRPHENFVASEVDSERALKRLRELAAEKTWLFHEPISTVAHGSRVVIDRYVFAGPETSSDPVRLALFGGLAHGEGLSTEALADFASDLFFRPELATGTHLYFYPSAFQAPSGRDLYGELWRESDEAEPYLIERELRTIGFHGVVTLQLDSRLRGFHAQLFGPAASLREYLVDKTLERVSVLLDSEAGFGIERRTLTTGVGLRPNPFELVLRASPRVSPIRASQSFRIALHSVLSEYRAISGHANSI